MTRKNGDYWDGYNAEAARLGGVASLARQVARALGRDGAVKQRIFARSPGVFSSMDAMELGQASSRELAERELRELGIEVGEGDPVQLLDAHHAGRAYARGQRGSAQDAHATSGAQAIIDTFLKE
jgi:hypothetical protein